MSEPKTTTLNKLRSFNPCPDGWGKLLKALGKTKADYAPLQMLTILESNGWDDALWCLRAFHAEHRQSVIDFACDCVERVLPTWEEWAGENAPEHKDAPRKAIEAARSGDGDAAAAATAAADAAAYAATYAAAARAAARAASYAADVADAVYAAADAACAAVRAASYAADATAYAAIHAAADAAAYAAVYAAERTEQEKLFIKHFG